jgi:Protein of unknown function (DUF2795)
MSLSSIPHISHSNISKNKNNKNKLEKKEQISTEYNEGHTLRVIRKQDHMPGERRNKIINDFPNTVTVAQILKDLDFPANKNKIIEFVYQQIELDKPEGQQILPILQKIEEKQYHKVADVTLAAKLVE